MLNIFVLILGFGYASCMFLIYESKYALNLTLQYVIRPTDSTQVCRENLQLMIHIYRYSWEVAFALQSVSKVIGIGKPEFEQFKVINKIQNCFKKVYRLSINLWQTPYSAISYSLYFLFLTFPKLYNDCYHFNQWP
jgi:hypothetical protein